MQFLTEAFIIFVTAYLSVTNQLADTIINIIGNNEEPEQTESLSLNTGNNFLKLPSQFSTKNLPDILLRSAAYQRATALTADGSGVISSDPSLALVNIFCTFTSQDSIRTTTGSGFFVHSDGVILTNAHVAQYLLLGSTDILGDAECIVRQGNPASPKYKAELLYIPPTWVQENASLINDAAPTGTGERDYALIYVTESIDGNTLPEVFPALSINSSLLPRTASGNLVTAAGYPATALIRNGSSAQLQAMLSTTTISELYTFGSNYADVFSIRGSSVGAEGSSGGPIIDKDGSVIGMIVTRGDDSTDGAGSLRAITTSYIHRTILEETGFSLARNISGNLAARSEIFTNTVAPFMIELLEQEISLNQ
jgi:hypothetical protein